MHKYYVYLKLSENRLIITKAQHFNRDYHYMMDSGGPNESLALTNCKMFCIGYMYGSSTKKAVINDITEFQ